MRKALVLVLFLAVTASANPFGVLVVLAPVNPGQLTGAFNTDWSTHLWVHNDSDIDGIIECSASDLELCPKVKAHSTMDVENPFGTSAPFFLRIRTGLIIPGPPLGSVWCEMRTTEIGTSARSAGTEIPLARPSDFRINQILPNVPINEHSRLRLRVYGMSNTAVSVRGIGSTSGQLLTGTTLQLAGNDGVLASAHSPSYAEQLLSVPVGADESMRVEITASSGSVWAFLTVTDNETQQFTVISPASPEYVPISVASLGHAIPGERRLTAAFLPVAGLR